MLSDEESGIIDYTDSEDELEDSPFVKIESKSWRKRRYWKDAEINSDHEAETDSDYDSDDSLLSNGSNRYQALCC